MRKRGLQFRNRVSGQIEPLVSKKFLEELDFLADNHGVVSIAFGEYGGKGKKFSIMTLDDEIRCVDETVEGVIHKAFVSAKKFSC
jgi:hypothetical protein